MKTLIDLFYILFSVGFFLFLLCGPFVIGSLMWFNGIEQMVFFAPWSICSIVWGTACKIFSDLV